MTIGSVGILSPGDMGAAIGRVLREGGLRVFTCLEGRSPLTRLRAAEAGIEELRSLDALVSGVDLVLSVLLPAEAEGLASRVAAAMRRSGSTPIYADCNAVSPGTVRRIAAAIEAAGARCLDAGIIGGPPKTGSIGTRIYCSGADVSPLTALNAHGLDVRVVGLEIGQASGLKMVYAASTKGSTALWTELLTAARALGLDDPLMAEFGMSRSDVSRQLMAAIPSMPRRARRWVGEMEEIATTFADLG